MNLNEFDQTVKFVERKFQTESGFPIRIWWNIITETSIQSVNYSRNVGLNYEIQAVTPNGNFVIKNIKRKYNSKLSNNQYYFWSKMERGLRKAIDKLYDNGIIVGK